MLPQTWEDSSVIDTDTQLYVINSHYNDFPQGDDDPMDVCELGEKELRVGEVCRAKILGAFCVADMHKFDWKVLVMNESEAKEKSV